METLSATVVEVEEQHFIEIKLDEGAVKIPISEDRPNDVKSAFNALIIRLKQGVFEIALDEVKPDLFSQVASEYITQLNRELLSVYGEMEEYDMVEIDI